MPTLFGQIADTGEAMVMKPWFTTVDRWSMVDERFGMVDDLSVNV